jgi:4-amino-4-deoxy-L-arabinose transferase-like glycosyltransferase
MADSSAQSPSAHDAEILAYRNLAMLIAFAVTLVRILVLMVQPVPLSMDEAQYWIWSRDLAAGYFSKPPLLAWIIAGTTSVCGDGEACIRISSPLLHAATAMVVFGIAKELADARVGLWSAVMYLLLPGVTFSSVLASTDVPLLLCWAAALHALARLIRANELRWWLLLGAALGVGLLAKYAMLFFVPCVALAAIMDHDVRRLLVSRRAAAAGLLALIIVSPNIAWNVANGFVSYRHTVTNMNLGADLFHPAEVAEFIGAQIGVFGPILFAGVAVAALKLSSQRDKLLACFSLPIILVIAVQALLSRANANWAATAYIAATVWVCAWALETQRKTWLWTAAGLHVFAMAVLYNYDSLAERLDVTLTRKTDPLLQARGWNRVGNWSSGLQADNSELPFLFDDRRVMAEVIYYTRPHPADAQMWAPNAQPNNHFEMTSRLKEMTGGDFIYVTRRPEGSPVLPAFDEARPLGRWRTTAYPGHDITLNAFLVRGFRGYSDAAAPNPNP